MTIPHSPRKVFLFDDFVPGTVLGEGNETYDAAQVKRWQSLFGNTDADGAAGPAEQASLATLMMMRAYLNIVAPRPPGNIHAGQNLNLCGLPRPAETVRLAVRCIDKALRRERRFVELGVICNGDDDRDIFSGKLTLIWAA